MSRSWAVTYTGRRFTRRRFLASSAAGAGAVALIACSGDSSPGGSQFEDASTARQPGKVWNAANDWKLADETKEAVPGGVYRGVMPSTQAGSFDALLQAPSQVPFSGHVHEYLMGRNRGPGVVPASPEAGVPVPVLAESWEISPDGMTVTFTLRPNVKFHPVSPVNGRVMDMEDWRTTLERFLELSPQRSVLRDIISRIEYTDARHMVWKLKSPYSPLVSRIWSERVAFQIIPRELNLNEDLAGSTSIGTGYKVLDKNQPAITMEYRKHADYWGGEPFIDRWHFPIIPEYSNRYAQFVAGHIIDFTPTAREVLQLAKDVPQAVIVANPIADNRFEWVNFGKYEAATLPTKDPRVRIAIRRAIDFKGIGEHVSNKHQFESAGIPVEVVPMTHVARDLSYWLDPEKGELGDLSANYLFDVAEAKKLTGAAGHAGLLDIQWTVLPEAGELPEQEGLAIDSLNKSGVFEVNVKTSANTVEHRECRSLGNCVGLAQSGIAEDPDYILRKYHSEGARPGAEIAYPNADIDRIADTYRLELDAQKRLALLKELQMVAAKHFPTVPFVHDFTSFSFRWPWLHNLNHGDLSGQGTDGRPVWGGHVQWLDPDMPRRNG